MARTLPNQAIIFTLVSSSLILVWSLWVRIPESLPTKCQAHLILLQLTVLIMFGEEYRQQSSSLCNFLQPPGYFLPLSADVVVWHTYWKQSHCGLVSWNWRHNGTKVSCRIYGVITDSGHRCSSVRDNSASPGNMQGALLPGILGFRGGVWNRGHRKCSPSQQASLRRPTLRTPYDQRVTCTIIMFLHPPVSLVTVLETFNEWPFHVKWKTWQWNLTLLWQRN